MPLEVNVSHLWKFFFGIYFCLIVIGLFFGIPFGLVFFVVFGIPVSFVITLVYKKMIVSDVPRESVSGVGESVVSRGKNLVSGFDSVKSGDSSGSSDEGVSDRLEVEKIGYED